MEGQCSPSANQIIMKKNNRKSELIEAIRKLDQEHHDIHFASFGSREHGIKGHYDRITKEMHAARKAYLISIGCDEDFAWMTDDQRNHYEEMYDTMEFSNSKYSKRMDEISQLKKPLKRELTAILVNEFIMDEENSIGTIIADLEDVGGDYRLKKIALTDLYPRIINRKSSLPKITDYQMFSKEGNIACQELVDKAMEISAEDRAIFVEQGMIEIANTHKEVHDTEPRETIYSKTKINK